MFAGDSEAKLCLVGSDIYKQMSEALISNEGKSWVEGLPCRKDEEGPRMCARREQVVEEGRGKGERMKESKHPDLSLAVLLRTLSILKISISYLLEK